ncbi:MAG: aspartate-semialdehyde dehydrogenase [Rhodothermales bacterium]|nr:aspartate-semialdehyde dehydrogenase [Rhodothermales bacterium]
MSAPQKKLRVAVLGATGAVGQQFIRLLDGHPWFDVTAVCASERSAGKTYAEAAKWVLGTDIPASVAGLTVQDASEIADVDLAFSGLDASVAQAIERAYAEAGIPVVSNTRNYRMQADVPLLIPEVNPDHTALVERQSFDPAGRGFIVTNPNCSTVGLVCALKPLHDAYGVEALHVVTMQALSGAGYPGVPSLDSLANVIPHIGGEEDKMAAEPLKILGTLGPDGVENATFTVSAQCNRVPVWDGHLLCVSVKLRGNPSADEARETLRNAPDPLADLGLPTSPERWLLVDDAPDAPQTRRHVHRGNGMTVSVGKVQPCPVLGVKFVALVHNTVRGAAGGAVLNAELLVAQGRIVARA